MPTPVRTPFSEVEPFLRSAGPVLIDRNHPQDPRVAYDHRLFYILHGSVVLSACGSSETLAPEDVYYLPSGTPYSVRSVSSNEPAQLFAVNFDFTSGSFSFRHSFPFVSPSEFQPEHLLETIEFPDTDVFSSPFHLRNLPELYPYLRTLQYEVHASELLASRQINCLLIVVLNLLYRAASAPRPYRKENSSYRQILEYIQEHSHEELSNRQLGERFNYHPNYINQLVLSQTGYSLHRYLLEIRVRKATQLLLNSRLSIAEIAETVGFRNVSYFSQYYRKCTGCSPSAVREPERAP